MEGILNINKPSGMTSFDVVSHIKRKTGEKAGHAGTLDPEAAGVLPVCIGKATRVIEYMSQMSKGYRAEMVLGIETDTQDGTGNVTARHDVKVNRQQVESVLKGFMGATEQIPPMYSAVKMSGRKLYELAREGITVERKPRRIEIYHIEVVDFYGDTAIFDVECSKGTYIRTLCHDAGRKLGCGAHMKFLLRSRVGPFLLKDSFTLQELEGNIPERLLPLDAALGDYERLTLSVTDAFSLTKGQVISLGNQKYRPESRLVRVYDESGTFLAVGEIDRSNYLLRPRKVFYGGTNEDNLQVR